MLFQLQNITKTYKRRGHAVTAFQSATLSIAQSDYIAVVGPSGSGKTTLLSMLGGMLSPDVGQVWFDGISLYEQSIAQRAKLRCERFGFVFQTFNLIPYLTAIENVCMPMLLAGIPAAEHHDRAAALLEQVGLSNRMTHKPSELSTGQQQRVALARTLANDPRVILADEPTGNLDPASRETVLAMFDEFIAQGRTIVMVTHDPAAAQRANRRLCLRDGVLLDEASEPTRIAA